MECRAVEIKLISASGIKDVNTLSKMDVYVTVSVSGDPRSVQRSPIDKDGGINPRWNNYDVKFVVEEVAAQNSRIGFVFQIMSNRTLGDKEAGRVYIPVKELLDRFQEAGCVGFLEVEYQVRTPTGKLKGTFKFSYAIGDKFKQKVAPIVESSDIVFAPTAEPLATKPVATALGMGLLGGLLIGEMVDDVADLPNAHVI